MQDIHSILALEVVVNDLSLHPIVRHEAVEALGAIGSESVIPLLKNSLTLDPAQEFRETCELKLSRIEEMKNSVAAESSHFFSSQRKRGRTPTPGYLGLKSTRGDGFQGDHESYSGGSSRDDYGYQSSYRHYPYRGGRDYSPRRSTYGGGGDYSLRRSPACIRPRRDSS